MVWSAVGDASEAWAAKADHPFFDGVDDQLNLGDVHDQLGSFTLEADIYPFTLQSIDPGVSPQMRIIWKVQAGTIGWILSVGDGADAGRIRAQLRNPTDNGQLQGIGFLTINVWQHVAFTFELGTLIGRLYYDGAEIDQETLLGAGVPVANDLFIGSGKNKLSFFNGRMRNVRIWSVQRTQAEILANIDRAVPADSPGLDLQRFAWTDKAAASSSWSDV